MTLLLIIFFSLLFSAFFSGTEIAFVSLNRLRIKLKSKKGLDTARIISGFLEKPSSFISALLIGNNIALVIYGSAMAKLLEPQIIGWLSSAGANLDVLVLLVQTIISTIVVLIFGEFLPKTTFRLQPHRILAFFSVPLKYFYDLIRFTILWFIDFCSGLFLKWVFKIDNVDREEMFSKFDLYHFMAESTAEGTVEESDVDMNYFQKAMFLNEIKARECMVHRTEVDGIEVNQSIGDLIQMIEDTDHSKILVFEENIDNIIGFVHFSDLYQQPASLKEIIKPIGIVPEGMPAFQLLKKLTEEKRSIALVLDEFGGTAGIVTLEDVMEEIFGEIDDEHDVEDLVEVQLNDKQYVFSARHEVDYINEKYSMGLPQGDFETLGGMLFSEIEKIPSTNEVFEIGEGRFEIKVLSASDARVEKIKVSILKVNEG